MKRLLRYDIYRHAKQILYILLEGNSVQQTAAFLHLDQKIKVAGIVRLSAGGGAEQPDSSGTVLLRQAQDFRFASA